MCLSTVYKNKMDEESILMRNVASIECDGDLITLIDLMDRKQVVKGQLEKVGLTDGFVVIRVSE